MPPIESTSVLVGGGSDEQARRLRLFWRFDPAHCAPGQPERTAAESDCRISLISLHHLDLVFSADRVRARIYLDNGAPTLGPYPDESSTDCYGTLANGAGFDSSDKVAAFTVDSLNRAIAFITSSDRSLSCC